MYKGKLDKSIKKSRSLIMDKQFKIKNTLKKGFVRSRSLTFPRMITLIVIVQKSLNSLQLKMNKFSLSLDTSLVTASAFSQARANLYHTAFITLNKEAVIDIFYEEGEVEYYKGTTNPTPRLAPPHAHEWSNQVK